VPEEQIAARFQRVVEPLHQRAPALFGKVDQYVHAENHVHAADVHRRSKVHLRKRNHLAQSWLYLMPSADLRKVARQLSFAHAGDAAAFVDSALGVLQGVTSDIGRKYFRRSRHPRTTANPRS